MGLIHVLALFKLIISIWTTLSFPRWLCLDGYNPNYIGMGVVHLCLCHVTQIIATFSANQQQMSSFSASCLDDISANLRYLHLESSHRRWIQVIDQNNASVIKGAAPISPQMTSWGTNVLFLIMKTMIDTKGLSKSFQ